MEYSSIFIALFLLSLTSCSKSIDAPLAGDLVVSTTPSEDLDSSTSNVIPVPDEEPSSDVVEDLIFAQYEDIDAAGGLPVTVTATGQGLHLRAKLWEAHKEKCTPSPQAPDGWYECELSIKLSLTSNGSDPAAEEPSEQGARIGVKWDPSGKWVSQ